MNVPLFLEIKTEYTEHLVDTLTPYIYEGLNSIYHEADKIATQTNAKDKTLLCFQKLLESVNTWNQLRIEEETNRIKQMSNTADYLDKLVKAVIKSNIILLSYSNSISNLIGQTFYNTLTTQTFIHRCYTECAKDAHNNPYLFYADVNPMDIKRNQIIVKQNIREGIVRAIRKILPISMILEEYLVNSINIIQEPPKVELLGMPPNPAEQTGTLPKAAGEQKIASEKKVDPKLEKEVMKLIKSESAKSDKQKIQTLMGIEKIITSTEPNKLAEMSAKNSSNKAQSSASKKSSVIAPNLVEQADEESAVGRKQTQSVEDLINIDFEAKTNEDSTSKKTVSGTTLSGGAVVKNNVQRLYTENSERVDPSKIKFIEDYGQGSSKKKK